MTKDAKLTLLCLGILLAVIWAYPIVEGIHWWVFG